VSIAYVPVVVPPQPPSRQAQELAELLSRVISEYEQTHSSITPGEVQQALMMAQQRGSGVAGVRGLVALGLGLAAALGIAVMVLAGGSGAGREAVLPWVELGIVGVLVIAVVVVVLRRRP
jgi:hypothetical protein